MITYLKHSEIDQQQWDLCLDQCNNSLVYGYSWYLNIAAPGWDALVLNNYEAVMPLTHHTKLFIPYLYQPYFTQQLGVFSKTSLSPQMILAFIDAIPIRFKFIDINLNESNEVPRNLYKLKKRKNYLLNLQYTHAVLSGGYDEHCKRNIKKAKKNNLLIQPIDIALAVAFYQKYKGDVTQQLEDKDYQRLVQILVAAEQRKLVIARGVFNAQMELLAVSIFVIHKGRMIYLLGGASEQGREARGMYLLFDDIILHFSEHPMILDFEGSEIPGIARFFKGFGAQKRNYYKLRINRLPWIVRWLK
ncbi:MAG: hypothetical protein MUE96_09210 [Bacteroidia bacterium]|jgi:hypothetical protein|nr:hypothetical protein [Bacteroidia bacterium]